MQATRLPLTGASLAEPLDFTSAGMPSIDSIHDAVAFTPTPGGATYHILRTIEFDSYETSPETGAVAQLLQRGAPSAAALAAALRPSAVRNDNFAGTARRACKLAIASAAQLEQFADIHALIASLTADEAMIAHVPPISSSATSRRVKEEQRNVRVVGYLYAASREADNDFHLVVGRNTSAVPEMYMTMEVSGLPPSSSSAFKRLKTARDSFHTFFGPHLPLLTYDFYHPPIPVVVEGSLFFDIDHAIGQHPGPPSLKSRMPTIWEVHPVTAITLGTH